MRSNTRDYYEIMGLPHNASQKEIKKAFRKLAQQYHPDSSKKQDTEDKFKEVCEAYEVLGDPKKREMYDKYGMNWRNGGETPFDPGNFRQHGSFSSSGSMNFDFDDLFSSFFGNMNRDRFSGGFNAGSGKRRGPDRGKDLEADINITLEEAFHGATRNITLESGTHGAPSWQGSKNIQVNIPKGIMDKAKIRLMGQGGYTTYGGEPGDLYLIVHVLPHSVFKWTDKVLCVEVPVTPWELALGASITVPTLDGLVKMKIAPGTQNDQKFRLQEKGFINKEGKRMPLIVIVKAVIPKELTVKERELFEELAKYSTFNPRKDR